MFDQVRALAAILAETGVGEIEVTEGTRRIRIVATAGDVVAAPPEAPEPGAFPPAAEPATAAPPAELVIRAPMHGVFHRAPGPGQPPFVSMGETVAAGQAVGILEAMKVFNKVTAIEAGVVIGFGAENA